MYNIGIKQKYCLGGGKDGNTMAENIFNKNLEEEKELKAQASHMAQEKKRFDENGYEFSLEQMSKYGAIIE